MGSSLRALHYDLIEPDGHVVCNSCSTGGKRLNAPNVAEWVKLGAGPQRRVTGPKKDTRNGSIRDYDPINGTCKIHYKWEEDGSPIGEDLTYSPSYETALKKLQEQVVHNAAKRHRGHGCFQRLIRRFVNRAAT